MRFVSLGLIAAIASLPVHAAPPRQVAAVSSTNVVPPVAKREPALPPPEAMIVLIRASLVALSQANTTNNYTVLSALGSQDFRSANPPARLSQIFGDFRANNIDLTPVTFVTPQLTQQPLVSGGKMRLVGYFPTQPMQVNFDLQFEPSSGTWKLFGLGVNLARGNSAPTSPPKPR